MIAYPQRLIVCMAGTQSACAASEDVNPKWLRRALKEVQSPGKFGAKGVGV